MSAAAADGVSAWTEADLPPLPYAPPAADCRWGARAPAFFDWQRVLPFLAPLLAWRRALLRGLGPQQGTARLVAVHVEGDPEPVMDPASGRVRVKREEREQQHGAVRWDHGE